MKMLATMVVAYLGGAAPWVMVLLVGSMALKEFSENVMKKDTKQLIMLVWKTIEKHITRFTKYLERNSYYNTHPSLQRPFDKFMMRSTQAIGIMVLIYSICVFTVIFNAHSLKAEVVISLIVFAGAVIAMTCLAYSNDLRMKLAGRE